MFRKCKMLYCKSRYRDPHIGYTEIKTMDEWDSQGGKSSQDLCEITVKSKGYLFILYNHVVCK